MKRAAALLALLSALLLACAGGGEGPDHLQARGAAALYFCPMHPQVTSDRPGSCPICGMDLVPRGEGDAAAGAPGALPGKAAVKLDGRQADLLNLRLEEVRTRDLQREVRVSASVVPAETRLHRVTSKVGGYVERLFVGATGQAVRRGEPLLTLYSPELYATQREYLTALAAADRLRSSPSPEVARGGTELASAARSRLKLWDISEGQIRRLEETREPSRTVTLYAPASGSVSERLVLEGQRIDAGEPLLVVADLSRVWAEADVPESASSSVQVGTGGTLTVPAWPGREFLARVTFVDPFLDTSTRTVRARLEIPNGDGALKPGMYGEVRFDLPLGEVLAVPASAVMRDGLRAFVFLDVGGGGLAPVQVQVGPKAGDFVQVLSGLKEGDRVAVSANFLLDSESSLKAALDAALARSAEPPAGHGH